jgi:hypothetical protein
LQQAREKVKEGSKKMSSLSGQNYLPTASNMETIDGNVAALHQAIDPVLARTLLPTAQRLAQLVQDNPQHWKTATLDPAIEKLNERAKSRGVTVRPDFTFGFNRYARSGPSPEAFPLVAKQFYAVDRAATLLLDSGAEGGVSRLDAIRRTFDEEGIPDDVEQLAGHAMVGGPAYNRYPIEIDFTGTTAGLRNFLNAVAKSPDLFIVRSVQVANSRPDSPRLPQGNSLKGPEVVLGNDTLQLRVWLDLVEWTGAAPKGATQVSAATPATAASPEN